VISALDTQRARAVEVALALVARSPAQSIASIFVGGSLGRNEVWAAEIDGVLEVYSDLDVYVVAREAHVTAVRTAAADVVSRLPDVVGVRFLRAPDVGVYSPRDLRAQPVRPGTLGLAVHHVLLHGDATIPAGLAASHARGPRAEEALYLLENRVLELGEEGGAPRDDARTRLQLLRALKSWLDVHSAHAIVAGAFAPTLVERAVLLASNPPLTLDTEERAALRDAYRGARDVTAWFSGRDAALETERARGALARAWCVLAPVVLDARQVAVGPLVARRCRSGAFVSNGIEAMRLRRFVRPSRARAVMAAPWLCARSPRAALRMDALVRQLRAEGRLDASSFASHGRYVERLTARFGFAAGEIEMRVRNLHRMIS
jgi:hypothetical protein